MVLHEGTFSGDGNHECRHRHWRDCSAAVDRLDSCSISAALALGILYHGCARTALDDVVANRLLFARATSANQRGGTKPDPFPRRGEHGLYGFSRLLDRSSQAPADSGHRAREISQRCRVVLLSTLAAEVSLRCARIKHQTSWLLRLDSAPGCGYWLSA